LQVRRGRSVDGHARRTHLRGFLIRYIDWFLLNEHKILTVYDSSLPRRRSEAIILQILFGKPYAEPIIVDRGNSCHSDVEILGEEPSFLDIQITGLGIVV